MFCIIFGRLCMASTLRDSTPAGDFFWIFQWYRPEIHVSQESSPWFCFRSPRFWYQSFFGVGGKVGLVWCHHLARRLLTWSEAPSLMPTVSHSHLSNEKNPGFLGCIGDYTTQYMGILWSQYKDPYKPTSIMESRRVFFVAHLRIGGKDDRFLFVIRRNKTLLYIGPIDVISGMVFFVDVKCFESRPTGSPKMKQRMVF